MEGSSATKLRDQHSQEDQTPNASITPQQIEMTNVTSCNENQTLQQMTNVTSCNENQTLQQTTNVTSCNENQPNGEIMGHSIIIPKRKRGQRRAGNTWSMLGTLEATPPSAGIMNQATNSQASDIDAYNMMLLAEVCEQVQMKGLDELILEYERLSIERNEE